MPSPTPATLPPPTQSLPASQQFKPSKACKSLLLPRQKVSQVLSPLFDPWTTCNTKGKGAQRERKGMDTPPSSAPTTQKGGDGTDSVEID
ncbi:hypothetical protein BYT27DRAFT_7254210 [Phlegmacium glaucopus]|nr:hypothetical protein BYT27DRAFT_7254210 [Phlegmacium glaucopus]